MVRTEVAAVLLLPFERGLECSAPNFINEANFCQQEAASAAAASPSPSPKMCASLLMDPLKEKQFKAAEVPYFTAGYATLEHWAPQSLRSTA